MPGIREEKPQNSTSENMRRVWRQFCGRSSPGIAGAPPKTRKGRCPVVKQSFGMYNIRCIVFKLCVSQIRKKEYEQKWFFMFGFLHFGKVTGTYRVDLATK